MEDEALFEKFTHRKKRDSEFFQLMKKEQRNRPVARCNGKTAYKEKELAEKILKRNIEARLRGVKYLRVYECPEGKHWHLTRSKPRKMW